MKIQISTSPIQCFLFMAIMTIQLVYVVSYFLHYFLICFNLLLAVIVFCFCIKFPFVANDHNIILYQFNTILLYTEGVFERITIREK